MSYSFNPKDDVETQWKKWLDSGLNFQDIDIEKLRERTIKDLSYVSQMDVREYTLYQKWCEVQTKYPSAVVNDLWEGEKRVLLDEKQRRAIDDVKQNIWIPNSPEDYLDLEPELLYTSKQEDLPELWNCIRTFSSTMKNNANIGRNLNFIVRDKITKKYLGVICISSDFLDLTPRDKYIGWDRELKTKKMINHSAIGSTIVPLQPLGFNYVGGKLLALLCLSDTVQNMWEKLYGDKLVAITTTSLYGKTKAGGLSQYDNLDYWQSMGFTAGSVSFEPLQDTRYMIRNWLMKNHTRKYFEWYVAKKPSGQPYKRDHKNRSLQFVYSQMNIPKEMIRSEHARGIYWTPLYAETCEFLRGEHDGNNMKKCFESSVSDLSNIWKQKHAKPRIKQLVKKDRVSSETLFYDDLTVLTWEQAKEKYLPQVGR
jgi:hypothetical protein